MKQLAPLLLLALALVHPAPASDALPRVGVEPAFFVRDGEPSTDWPAHPGEVIGLSLEWPEDARPARPALGAHEQGTTGGLLPLRLVTADPRAGGRDVLEVLPIALGSAKLPELRLLDEQGEARALIEELELEIAAALADSDTEPAPARAPIALGLDPLGLAIVALAALLALGLAIVAWRRWGRSSGRSLDAPDAAAPELSSRERALRALAALLESGLHRRGEQKAFGVALAEIGKDFFAGSHEITLRERTSWECAPLLRRAGCPEDAIAWLEGWLARIDLVKFAGARPAADELEALALALRARVEGAQ